MDSVEDQLIDLQTRIAYQDETLAQLNEAVTSQQREIDRLRLAVSNLTSLVSEGGEAGTSLPDEAEQKPPHY